MVDQWEFDNGRVRVLFVCTGNICRSPTAEGVFRQMVREANLAERIAVESAGLHDYNAGKPPDPRSCAVAWSRGYRIDDVRARKVSSGDLQHFDLVLAMDRGHHQALSQLLSPAQGNCLRLFLDFAPETGVQDVPDPYYGGPDDFLHVFDLIEAGCRGVLDGLRKTLR